MMRVIFTAFVGAIIGYITNWLAIKMLFRPHEEKRIFGLKVPFTPGLIPKERDRIARSVGEAIGKHLLTSETLVESLCSDEMNGKLRAWVKDKIIAIEEKGASIGDEIKVFVGAKYDKLIAGIEDRFAKYIVDQLKNKEVRQKLILNIMVIIKEKLELKTEDMVNSNFYKGLKDKLSNEIFKLRDSKELMNVLNDAINNKVGLWAEEDKKLSDVLPKELTGSIKVYIYNNSENISLELKKFLQEESVNQKIRATVSRMIGANLSPMIAMFVNPDSINDKLFNSINNLLEEEATQKDIAVVINNFFDKIIDKQVKEIKNSLGDSLNRNIETLSKTIVENVFEEKNVNNIIEVFERKIENKSSLRHIVDEFDGDLLVKIEKMLHEEIIKLTNSEEFNSKVNEYIHEAVNKILELKLKDISLESGKSIEDNAADFAQMVYDRFVENSAADFIEAFEIRKIVEDKINALEVEYAEEIILDIASKELSAITWLGALLGCIMGLLSSIISFV